MAAARAAVSAALAAEPARLAPGSRWLLVLGAPGGQRLGPEPWNW